MTSVAIRVPISLNQHFVTMTQMLARSITRFARLKEWRLELTVSRDTDLDLDSDLLAWTADYPVATRWVDRDLFARYSWWGTAIQRHFTPTDMDVVAFMDADTLAVGSLEDAFSSVLEIDGVAGRTAWAPPDVDLEALLVDVADAADLQRHVYAGYGTRMLAPKHCPPYFNFGFVVASRNAVQRMAPAMMHDLEVVFSRATSFFNAQIALCRTLLRLGIPTTALHDKFNVGTSQRAFPPLADTPDVRERIAALQESLSDPRVLHYCPRQAEAFDKSRDMASLEAARRFAYGPEMQRGARVLQRVLQDLL